MRIFIIISIFQFLVHVVMIHNLNLYKSILKINLVINKLISLSSNLNNYLFSIYLNYIYKSCFKIIFISLF